MDMSMEWIRRNKMTLALAAAEPEPGEQPKLEYPIEKVRFSEPFLDWVASLIPLPPKTDPKHPRPRWIYPQRRPIRALLRTIADA